MRSSLLLVGVVVAMAAGITCAPAAPRHYRSCAGMGMGTSMPHARELGYTDLIAGVLDRKVQPSEVTIRGFLSSGSWSVVYAEVPIADPGYFFFEKVNGRPRFKDVWGGVAQPDERPQVIAWVRKLDVPESLAVYFADTVIGE